MTVDSEAIFALAAHSRAEAGAFEDLRGAMATAWLDERAPDVLYAARGVGRPLWLGTGRGATFFASTKEALQGVERYARIRLRKRAVPEGTMVALSDGRVAWTERFRPDPSFVEDDVLPAIRTPDEGAHCLRRLASLVQAA
jgi:asparagine synthetase B (glutamine-hydrolysing)